MNRHPPPNSRPTTINTGCCSQFLSSLFRLKRPVSNAFPSSSGNGCSSNTTLRQCLSTGDLTHLGIGSILGAGIYVVCGQVALSIAGPSIILSLSIAAVASLLSGLCYAEFGSRVPHTTGSAYAYSYHTLGEWIAFVIGWNLILEYMIGTAADARALSGAVDYLTGYALSNFSLATFGQIPHLQTRIDVLALVVTLAVTAVLAYGVKHSARYTMLFNCFNASIAIVVVMIGVMKADPSLWSDGKFFPNGLHGVMAGAAACFYAFVGFDIIATTGEEAYHAASSIPTAIAMTLVICYALYVSMSVVLTMLMPFGELHNSQSPLTAAFDYVGFAWAKWIIGLGAVFGLGASLIGSQFPLPRIIYAMAVDGLLFKMFSKVNRITSTPLYATIVPGIFTSLFALMFELRELVEMMSMGTLLAYSLVSTSVLTLRYMPPMEECFTADAAPLPVIVRRYHHSVSIVPNHNHPDGGEEEEQLHEEDEVFETICSENGCQTLPTPFPDDFQPLLSSSTSSLQHSPSANSFSTCISRQPTAHSHTIVVVFTILLWLFAAGFAVCMLLMEPRTDIIATSVSTPAGMLTADVTTDATAVASSWSIVANPRTNQSDTDDDTLRPSSTWMTVYWFGAVTSASLCVICALVIWLQPQDWSSVRKLHFHVPCMPWLPIAAIVINIFLMARLSRVTWIRFVVWLVIGMLLYFGYGFWHSEAASANQRDDGGVGGRAAGNYELLPVGEEEPSSPLLAEILRHRGVVDGDETRSHDHNDDNYSAANDESESFQRHDNLTS